VPAYSLERICEGKLFSCLALNDAGALFLLSKEVGRQLTFEGDGPPPFLLGEADDQGWVRPDRPVYSV
jgi:hypothetical protein